MKTTILLTIALFTLTLLSNQTYSENSAKQTIKLKCIEMTCSGCKTKITQALNSLDGVSKVKINLDKKIITVTFDDKKTTKDKIIEAIATVGYESELID